MHDQRLAARVPNRLQQLGGSDLGAVAQCARARREPRRDDHCWSRVKWSLRHFASTAARLSGVPDAYAAAGESPRQVGQTTSAPARADGVLVFPVLPRFGTAVALTEGSDHHQVVAEAGLRLEAVILRHGLEDAGVITGREPFQT